VNFLVTGNIYNEYPQGSVDEVNYHICSVSDTLNRLDSDESIVPQSGFEVKRQNVNFIDAEVEPSTDIPSIMDETRSRIEGNDVSLGEFMSRPLNIATFEWTPSSLIFYETFNPWNLFLENKRVVNRISNFKLAKMKLHVKFLINGNSFFYGRLMACYQPLEIFDNMTTNSGLVPQDNVQMSQFPRIFLDPTTSKGGEMTLPFFYYKDYMDMTAGDADQMGQITIRTLNSLKHMQGIAAVSELVTISVFAWATEVDLQAPTHQNAFGMVPQSGKDEYQGPNGPISKPASAIAAAATALNVIPAIRPFATATAMAAGATSKVASLMGYSAPCMVESPQYVLPRSNANMAVTNAPDSSAKLSMDVKQEVSIDPRILGLGSTDELDISYIASRDSYLTTFTWAKGTDPGTLLYNFSVDPCLHLSLFNTIYMPACCGATIPFKYWNGSMEFRLQIIASAFHRGRLAVVYDPDGTPTTLETNMAYTEIIDIGSCREFSMRVGNHQATGLMTHLEVGTVSQTTYMRPTPAINIPTGNGTISIWVINELTSSNTDNTINDDIEINIFMKACEDFEVFVPTDEMTKFVIKPQSGTDVVDPVNEPDDPYPGTDVAIGSPEEIVSHRNLVYSGEKITNFRSLLKRYYHHSAFGFHGASVGDRMNISMLAFPYYRGNVPGAVHVRAGFPPIAYSYAAMTMLNWLAPAFQALRGSTRFKIMPKNNAAGYYDGIDTFYVCRTDRVIYDTDFATMDTSNPSNLSYNSLFTMNSEYKMSGATAFNSSVNPVVEFELPYYSQYRFSPGKTTNWTTSLVTPGFSHGFTFWAEKERDGSTYYDLWVAAGEDFSFYFFTGWPRMYYEVSPPVPP
jgi:hypothetical protein